MNRRSFLSLVGLGTAGSVLPLPVRKSYFFLNGLWTPPIQIINAINACTTKDILDKSSIEGLGYFENLVFDQGFSLIRVNFKDGELIAKSVLYGVTV